MASRFWTRGSSDEDDSEKDSEEQTSSEDSSSDDSDSDSDSDSSSGSDSSSDSDDDNKANKFLRSDSDSDSDSDDDKRVVKSAKDRRYEELAATTDEIRNKMNINDWASIQSCFDKLNKQLETYQKLLSVTAPSGPPPRKYIRLLVDLEDFMYKTLANKDAKKKMSTTNAKALNTMKQRLKKHNAEYQEQMDAWRKNPESSADEESEEEESDSGPDSDAEALGKDGDEDGEFKTKTREKKKDKILTMKPEDITYVMVRNKLQEININRGKKGTDRKEQVEMLTYLASISKGPSQKLEVLLQIVGALFDINPSLSTTMATPLWKRCVKTILEILDVLAENPHISIDDKAEVVEYEDEPPADTEGGVKVWGNLVAFVERLDDEMFKVLQVTDPHTNEYLERLKDEPVFLALASLTTDYVVRIGDYASVSRLALRRMEHLYYKTHPVYAAMRKMVLMQQQTAAEEEAVEAAAAEEEDGGDLDPDADPEADKGPKFEDIKLAMPQGFTMAEDPDAVIQGLMTTILEHGDERTKARAMLCKVFYTAILGDFFTARDLLLMSHLQDAVQHMDISTQILYNRTMAQLGLCAFRRGLVGDAHSCLSELYGCGRIKELLAQGVNMGRYQEKTPEQEKLERRRQMPFHMHINLEMIESCALICAMLVEVPNLAAGGTLDRRKVLSKSFQRLLDTYDRQTFTGPPENVREHIMAATRALRTGDWAGCYGFVEGLSCWGLMDGAVEVKERLREHIKEEALRTFLFTYSAQYASLCMDQLCSTFDLPEKKVHGVVSKMMVEEELPGSWDQPTRTIVMHKVETSRLQNLAMSFADKVSMIVDLNERALSFRTGGLRDEDDEEEGGGGGGGRRGGGRGRGDGEGFGGRGGNMLRGLGVSQGGRRSDSNRPFRSHRDRLLGNKFEEGDFASRGQGKYASSRNKQRREEQLTTLGRPMGGERGERGGHRRERGGDRREDR
eukprot:CAMPEP_0177770216 /NCGR_PEP_ID=MMETSP0491_2-20121128/10794_1 /TAXON_ID=63592 /ORGANISM="Tetraselmis chuii, Strain PLY429" /LENGTH=962 /DNA_ID=CAMNT_0019287391 /DNA_START=118 /DNA_END=3006 /DNA_ORIENTATION=+